MTILENIKFDIDWRMGELASLKTIPHRYKMANHHISLLKTYLVPAIYAIWEGFVQNTMLAYILEINKKDNMAYSLRTDILLYVVENDDKLNLCVPRTNKVQQEKFITEVFSILNKPIKIATKVQTKSNVNLEVINHLLTTFGLTALPDCYRDSLNKLLNFRNKIAHGEKAIIVSDDHISEFTQLINNLMVEIATRIEEGLQIKSYLKN